MSGDESGVRLTDTERLMVRNALLAEPDFDAAQSTAASHVLRPAVECIIAERVRAAQAQALREAADDFDGPQSPLHITHASQALRDRADLIGDPR